MGDEGRPVPIHASGPVEAVADCIMCGLPYRWHDHNPKNWLACPPREKLVEIEAELEGLLVRITEALTKKGRA